MGGAFQFRCLEKIPAAVLALLNSRIAPGLIRNSNDQPHFLGHQDTSALAARDAK